MIKLLKRLIANRYSHLFIGGLLLYGIAWAVTRTTLEERIVNSLKYYCYADYYVDLSLFSKERTESEFYREKLRARLESLTSGLFDYRDIKQVQAFLLRHGFLYDAWAESKGRHSYLLAKIMGQGSHTTEVPESITFDYLILGKKRIKPLIEFRHGIEAGKILSAGNDQIYIHRDRFDSLLRWYFDSLWETEPKSEKSFYIEQQGLKDPLTYFLFKDLKGICEDIFMKRFYRDKKRAREYFLREGFNVFLPTMLIMAARMAADQGSTLHSDYQYLRAMLTGLSLNPNYTLFYILISSQPHYRQTQVRKVIKEAGGRVDFTCLEQLTLERISEISSELLKKM